MPTQLQIKILNTETIYGREIHSLKEIDTEGTAYCLAGGYGLSWDGFKVS